MKTYKIFIPAIVLFFISIDLRAQCAYSLSNYSATIKGTSNIHAWDETIEKIWGNGDVREEADGSFTLVSFKIVVEVKSIKGNEYPLMSGLTQRALKADKFPEIVFALDEPGAKVCCLLNSYSMLAKGRLTIAGVTKEVTMPIKIAFYENKRMTIDAEQQVKMTDYGVTPPTAFLGIVKTGNIITFSFKTTFLRT